MWICVEVHVCLVTQVRSYHFFGDIFLLELSIVELLESSPRRKRNINCCKLLLVLLKASLSWVVVVLIDAVCYLLSYKHWKEI